MKLNFISLPAGYVRKMQLLIGGMVVGFIFAAIACWLFCPFIRKLNEREQIFWLINL